MSFTVNLPVLSIFVDTGLARFRAPCHIGLRHHASCMRIQQLSDMLALQMRVKVGGV
ncbi:MAG: hypothetical protein ABIN99_12265 [Nitrosospira sp.]